MPSERLQRQIDRLLDQAEVAVEARDWNSVRDAASAVLRVDPDDEDAKLFLQMAGDEAPTLSDGVSEMPTQSAAQSHDTPSFFANGRYTVIRLLGEGGKKLVYLAHDATLDRDVAFGLIKTDGLDEVGRERILREAQAMGRMGTHPCIMPIYDLGEENGQPFMVQPPMGGGDVEELIEDLDGPLPLEQALQIANQTAQGLVFAHSKGIIHRDLKPGNVWLDDDGNAKIGDFGLAIATDRSRLTVEKLMVGTVNYMPPEQATGSEVTARADLYSLGAMLYEMSTGRVPFMGDDDIAVISQHVNTPAVAPSWHNPSIPRTLDSLITRLMSKNPDERPQTAEEVLQALDAVDLSVVEDTDQDQGSLEAMAGGVFVGRQREMDNLKSIFEEVLSGKGRMVTLVGDPGIGKTRTAHEVATYAGMRGAQVLWGRSYESGGAPPYWPWVQVIRSHVASTEPDALRNQMGSTASVIAEIVPDVKQKLPDLPPATPVDDPESARFRLFDSITTFLKQAASVQPLVLMLEDLHWSDKPSLMLLEFVARELANAKIMVIGNYRDMELNRRHPLSITLGDLTRERLFERILLRGLQKHDVARFIEIAAGITPPPALVEAVNIQTEGNPLFVTETVRLLIQEGDITAGRSTGGGTTSWEIRIPEGVREVIGRRLDRLSERCNELLTIAAVIGRQFRFDVLKILMEDTTDGQLLDSMDEALSAQILEELPEEIGLYQFTHALMQETLTSELSANRTVRMHARIAEALEAHYGDLAEDHAAELVVHFTEAETVLGNDKVERYAAAAGTHALSSGAFEDALLYLEIAWRDRSAVEDADSAVIRANMAKAYTSTANLPAAGEAANEAFEFFARLGDDASAIELVSHPFPVFVLYAIRESLDRAIELCDPGSLDEASVSVNRALVLFSRNQYSDSVDVLNKARDFARESGNVLLEMRVEAMQANVAGFEGDARTSVDSARAALELGRTVNDYVSELRSRLWLSTSLAKQGEMVESQAQGEKLMTRARHFKDATWMGRATFPVARAAIVRGQWEAAYEMADLHHSLSSSAATSAEIIEIVAGVLTGETDRTDAAIKDLLNSAGTHISSEGFGYHISMAIGIWGARQASFHEDLIPAARASFDQMGHILGLFSTNAAIVEWAKHESSESDTELRDAYKFLMGVEHAFDNIWFEPVAVQRARVAYLMGDLNKSIEHWIKARNIADPEQAPATRAWVDGGLLDALIERDDQSDSQLIAEIQDEAIAIATELDMQPILERVLAQREILKA